jgi:hypothetical protein
VAAEDIRDQPDAFLLSARGVRGVQLEQATGQVNRVVEELATRAHALASESRQASITGNT